MWLRTRLKTTWKCHKLPLPTKVLIVVRLAHEQSSTTPPSPCRALSCTTQISNAAQISLEWTQMIDHWNCGLTSVLLIWILESNNRQPQWVGECLPRVLHCLLRCVWERGCSRAITLQVLLMHTHTYITHAQVITALPSCTSRTWTSQWRIPVLLLPTLSSNPTLHPILFFNPFLHFPFHPPQHSPTISRSTPHCHSSPQLLLRHCLSQ